MDFVSDALFFNGQRSRALTVVDNFIRECLAIEADQSLTGQDVVQALARIDCGGAQHFAAPHSNRTDHGPEYVSLALDKE